MGIFEPEKYIEILRVCASQEEVRKEVLRNHDENLWWPLSIKDWKIRFLIAGLSSRVSYQMIKKFQQVREKLTQYSYEEIVSMPEKELRSILKPLGLINLRMRFFKSAVDFIEEIEKTNLDIWSLSNNDLITLIRKKVIGVNYHLAQCCALYVRGYYSGIIPVDSGMFKMFAPCLGLPVPKGAFGYEILRKELEKLTKRVDCRKIAMATGYQSLNLPKDKPLTWWVHLVLIYCKRIFCNKSNPENCPLRNFLETKEMIGKMCSKENSRIGGIKNIILEGTNGTGKTTIAEKLKKIGFTKLHANYHPKVGDLFSFYHDLLEASNINQRVVFDRTFISEMVYGPILRKRVRLSIEQFEKLLETLKTQKSILVYLYAPLEIISTRKQLPVVLKENYSKLTKKYEEVLKIVEKFVPVIRIHSGETDPQQIFSSIIGFEFPEEL